MCSVRAAACWAALCVCSVWWPCQPIRVFGSMGTRTLAAIRVPSPRRSVETFKMNYGTSGRATAPYLYNDGKLEAKFIIDTARAHTCDCRPKRPRTSRARRAPSVTARAECIERRKKKSQNYFCQASPVPKRDAHALRACVATIRHVLLGAGSSTSNVASMACRLTRRLAAERSVTLSTHAGRRRAPESSWRPQMTS